jgi:hypothetical protein
MNRYRQFQPPLQQPQQQMLPILQIILNTINQLNSKSGFIYSVNSDLLDIFSVFFDYNVFKMNHYRVPNGAMVSKKILWQLFKDSLNTMPIQKIQYRFIFNDKSPLLLQYFIYRFNVNNYSVSMDVKNFDIEYYKNNNFDIQRLNQIELGNHWEENGKYEPRLFKLYNVRYELSQIVIPTTTDIILPEFYFQQEQGYTKEYSPTNVCNHELIPGPKGDRGERGERGEKGDKGDKGDKGERGDRGERGIKGEKGDKGDRGEKGERGDRGVKGDSGERGEKGLCGERGPKGNCGERGPMGFKGDSGEQGEKGDRGDKGEKGDKGERGVGLKVDEYGVGAPMKNSVPIGYTYVDCEKLLMYIKKPNGDWSTGLQLNTVVVVKCRHCDTIDCL